MKLAVTPISLREANEFVENFHRHNKPTQGGKFAIGACFGGELVGVAIVGRPVARMLDDGVTAEVTRVCVVDHAPKNTCSFYTGGVGESGNKWVGSEWSHIPCKKSPAPAFVGLGGRL